jgi:hypothetical protein
MSQRLKFDYDACISLQFLREDAAALCMLCRLQYISKYSLDFFYALSAFLIELEVQAHSLDSCASLYISFLGIINGPFGPYYPMIPLHAEPPMMTNHALSFPPLDWSSLGLKNSFVAYLTVRRIENGLEYMR